MNIETHQLLDRWKSLRSGAGLGHRRGLFAQIARCAMVSFASPIDWKHISNDLGSKDSA